MLEAIWNGMQALVDSTLTTFAWIVRSISATTSIFGKLSAIPATFKFMEFVFPSVVWIPLSALFALIISLAIFRVVTRIT